MKFKRFLIWLISLSLLVLGFSLSVHRSGGRYQFEWKASELMAQQSNFADGPHNLAALSVYNRVLLQLQENYVETERFDPLLMLATALDEVQKSVPELLLNFDRDISDKPSKVRVQIDKQSREFSLDSIKSLWEMSLKLKEIFLFIQDYLPEDTKAKDIEYVAINGMLSTLDPHSIILSSEIYKEMSEGNRGKFGGLGIMVRMIDGVLVVMEPMPGEPPAVKAGMKAGDQILAIDGEPTLNMNVQEAVDLLKGEPATTVKLTVMRKDWKEPKIISVVRDEISIPSIESADLGDRVAYVKLKGFQSNSQKDLLAELESLTKKMGKINALILDLRGNPGGLLDQAVMIADDFLNEGVIVTTEGASKRYRRPYEASEKVTQPFYPIAVLIDSSSASASEIVAGALKNLNRAVVMGDTSFGKGSVQVLYELQDKSALKLTIAQYLTPGDQSIQSVGIVPDIQMLPMRVQKDDVDIYARSFVRREASLGGHLDNQKANKDLTPSFSLRFLSHKQGLAIDELDEESELSLDEVEKIIARESKDEKPKDMPQVKLAKKILLSAGETYEREEILKKFSQIASQLQADEDKALEEQLRAQKINWTKGENPENPQLSISISTSLKQGHASAGEKYQITATIENTGNVPLYRIVGISESSLKRVNDKEFIFGKIEAGEKLSRSIESSTSFAQKSRIDNFKLRVYADNEGKNLEKPLKESEIFLETKENPQAFFTINYAIIDKHKSGAGNSLLDDNETLKLRIWVANKGEGIAEKPLIFLKNKGLKEIKLINARYEPKAALKPNDTISYDFEIQTKDVSPKPLSLELHVYDKKGAQMLVEKIALQSAEDPSLEGKTLEHVNYNASVNAENTPIYVAPLTDANTLSKIDKNAVVQVVALYNGYSRIVSGDVQGWVISTALSATQAELSEYKQETVTTIPRIIIDKGMPLITSDDSIRLKAKVEASTALKDYYIYSITEEDHQIKAKKVAYEIFAGANNSNIDVSIPLSLGVNRIRIFTRDEKKSESYETVQIFRSPK